jgi:phosphoglycerol transferase MdoB-like AlkP superfamily enzyme
MTKQLKISFQTFLLLLVVYSFLRMGFYVSNLPFFEGIGASEIVLAFFHGLRFDVSAILWINLPLVLLYNLPYKPLQWAWYRVALFLLFISINCVGILLNVADYGYYQTVQRRLLYEPYTALPDIIRMMPAVIAHHFVLFAIFCAGAAGFVYSMVRFFRRLGVGTKPKHVFWKEVASLLVVATLSVIGIRGGLQLKPIRQTNAFFTSHSCVGYLTLNSTYTVVRSYFQPVLPAYELLPETEARTAVFDMLFTALEKQSDPEYPFRREFVPSGEGTRLNVVIFIMESWTAQLVNGNKNTTSYTPFFDSLASSGTLFTNFLANGQRSIEAVPAILTSVPALFSSSLIGSKAEMDNFCGLGTLLLQKGYTTTFHHGASLGSMGFDAFSRVAGMLQYFAREDVANLSSADLDGVWGVYDEPFFLESARRLSGLPQPFCSVIFSLSSHDPFIVPESQKQALKKYDSETEFEQSLRYSDYSLKRFFNFARSQAWFNNTVFIITGDHTFHSMRNNMYSAYHIPLLMYKPGIIPAQRIDRVGSQVDILPSILDLLQIRSVHASMGKSLFDSSRNRYAFVKFGPEFAVFSDSLVYVDDLEKKSGMYDYRTDPFFRKDLKDVRAPEAAHLRRYLYAYIQTSTRVIANDHIFKKAGIR